MEKFKEHWINYHKGVCSIDFYGSSNSKLMGVTGFRIGRQMISSDYVFSVKDCKKVIVRFYEADGLSIRKAHSFSYSEFMNFLPSRELLGNLGIAILELPEKVLEDTTILKFCGSCNSTIGTPALCIGYQYEHNNLSLKQALVSGHIYNEKNHGFIQFDGTVRPGFSGSPLIDYETGNVIGVVSNKEMKVVKTYRDIVGIVEKNLEELKKVEGKWVMNEIDPIQVLVANQNQIKHIARHFFANYSGWTGYALEINQVVEQVENHMDIDVDTNPDAN